MDESRSVWYTPAGGGRVPIVSIDFWDVLDSSGLRLDLVPICIECGTKSVEDRMKERKGEAIDYLDAVHSNEKHSIGTIARIRKNNWPSRANLKTGELAPLGLPDGIAIAEEMSFLFDRGHCVLATQRHPFFRSSAVPVLLAEISGMEIALQPKLRKDAWNRVKKMTRIGTLEVKLTGPTHHPDFSDVIPAMGKLLDEADEKLNVIDIGLHLSVGRSRKKELDRDPIQKLIALFRNEPNVSSLVVRGNPAIDEPSEAVDFIRDRLVFSGDVGYSGKHLERSQCQQLLHQAISQNSKYLKSLI